jgi:hypothetical protein
MPDIPLINLTTAYVDNIIVAEYTDAVPEGYAFGPPGGQIGWFWDNEIYVDPNPPPPLPPIPPPPEQTP